MSQFYTEPDQGQAGPGPSEKRLPRVEKRLRPQFRATASPFVWTWDQALGEWLPRLGMIRHDAGQNNVQVINGVLDTADAENAVRRKGGHVLPNPDPRLASALPADPARKLAAGTYASRTRANGGYAYHYVWDSPVEVQPGTIEWECDHDLRRSVLQAVKSEVLGGEPTVRWKRLQVRKQERQVQRLADKVSEKPGYPQLKNRLDVALEVLEAMRADLAKQEKAETPKPSRSTAKKAANG